ncbi:peptide ABC transporter substrate-binding protein [Maricaulis sp.]|uniref:peptide ABC transporter substrate-binding protein n=1 Tax=Maricaulis sp. TaxID=1486257 RepID=UPI003A93705C
MLNRRALLAASAATGLAACARTDTPDGLLRVAIETLPDSLDPALGEFASAALVYKQIHAGLTDYASDGSVAAGLATRWRVAPDGLSWVFTLREDARWSDGHPLTAQDVVWSARRLVDPQQSFANLGDFFAVANARAVLAGEMPPEAMGFTALDDHTIEVRLDTPLGLLPTLMREFYPFPRHAIEAHGRDWVRPENIVTAGAYTVTAASQMSLDLAKNPHYAGAAGVSIERIRIDAVRDAGTRTRMFRAGEYDLAEKPPGNQIGYWRERLGDRFRSFDAPILRYLKVNHARAGLDTAAARQALSVAIDRGFIAANFFDNTARATHRIIPEDGEALDPIDLHGSSLRPTIDPELPRRVEIRTVPGVSEQIAIAIADDWRRVGVEAELLVSYPTDLYQAIDGGDFDVAVASFNRGLKADPFFMLDPFAPGGFAANFNWDNPDFAAEMELARRESDPVVRAIAYRAAEAILIADQAIIPLLHERAHWLVSNRIAGTRADVQPMLWRDLGLANA